MFALRSKFELCEYLPLFKHHCRNTTALDHQMLSAAIGSVNVAVHVDSPCLLIVIRFTMRSCKNIRVVPRCLGCHVAG